MNAVANVEGWVVGNDGIIRNCTHGLCVVPSNQFAEDRRGMDMVVKWGDNRCLSKVPFEAGDSTSEFFGFKQLKDWGFEWVILSHASQTLECCDGLLHTLINTKSDGTVNVAKIPHELLLDLRYASLGGFVFRYLL